MRFFLTLIIIIFYCDISFAARTEKELLAKYSTDGGTTWSPEFKNYTVSAIKSFLTTTNVLQLLLFDNTDTSFKNYKVTSSNIFTNKIGLVFDPITSTFVNAYLTFLEFGLKGIVSSENYIIPSSNARFGYCSFKKYAFLDTTTFDPAFIIVGGKAGTPEIFKNSILNLNTRVWETTTFPDGNGAEFPLVTYLDDWNERTNIYIFVFNKIISYNYFNNVWTEKLALADPNPTDFSSQTGFAIYNNNYNNLLILYGGDGTADLKFYTYTPVGNNFQQQNVWLGDGGCKWQGFKVIEHENYFYIIGGKSNRAGIIKYNRIARLHKSTYALDFLEDFATPRSLSDDAAISYGFQVNAIKFNNNVYVFRDGQADSTFTTYTTPITKMEKLDLNNNLSSSLINLTGDNLGNITFYGIYADSDRIRVLGGEGVVTGTQYGEIFEIR